MKFEHNPKYTAISVYCLIVAAFTMLCVVCGLNFHVFTDAAALFLKASRSLIYAFVFAFMMNPLLDVCENHLFGFLRRKRPHNKLRKTLGVITSYLIVIGCITAFVLIFIPQIVSSYRELSAKFSGYIDMALGFIEKTVSSNEILSENYDTIMGYADKLVSSIYKFIENLTPYMLSFATSFVTEAKNILLGFIFSVYFLIESKLLKAQAKKLLCALLPQKAYNYIIEAGRLSEKTFREFFIGKMLDAILMGLLCLTLMTAFGMPYAPLISLILGISSFVPYVGTMIGAVPGLLILIIADPPMTLWFLIIVIILQIADGNFIEPKILGKSGMSSMWVLVAIIFMSGFFGITGLIAGVPVFGIIYMLFKSYVEQCLRKKGMPIETDEYVSASGDSFIYSKITKLPTKFSRRNLRK